MILRSRIDAAVEVGHFQRGSLEELQSCIKYSVVQVAPAIYAAFSCLPRQSVRISPIGFCLNLLRTTHSSSNPAPRRYCRPLQEPGVRMSTA